MICCLPPYCQVRANRDTQAVESSLAEVVSAAKGTGNILAAAVKAARARATLGEISSAMEEVTKPVFYCLHRKLGNVYKKIIDNGEA